MKNCRLFLFLFGIILIIISGCNFNDFDQPADEITVEFGTELPQELGSLDDLTTKAGADWAGWYNACLSWTGVYNIYVYPYYSSTERYGVYNYMCDENKNVVYWVRFFGFTSAVPYAGFSFNYTYDGNSNQLYYYTSSSVKKVKHSYKEGASTYSVNYTKQ